MPPAPERDDSPPETVEIAELRFDNRFTRELPADPDESNTRRQVETAVYSRVHPQRVAAPRLVHASAEMLAQLGIEPETAQSQAFADVFAGHALVAGMDPHAMCYGGHQFGHWAGQLGDGRAINLGEVCDVDGRLQMLQLKGAGPTPYSRTADGLAVLRSSVREFLCSEAMHHLGVPTTRALSLVLTGDGVVRDMFYDGRPEVEPGAVVCRVAPSFLRFGNYEIWAARGRTDLLRQLADFTIRTEFAELLPASGEPDRETYVAWYAEVCRRTAEMVVHWMRVGFVHGVMNTDNMSILGLTIDYGPYGWLENYDPDWTPNTTDAAHRRYRFGTQGQIAGWDLMQLANALVPLIEEPAPLQEVLDGYLGMYESRWQSMMATKLGLPAFDAPLVEDLLALLAAHETDMTVFYRRLAAISAAELTEGNTAIDALRDAYYGPDPIPEAHRARTIDWLAQYAGQVRAAGVPDAERRAAMDAVNPKYVLRNYLAQLAIDKATQGDFGLVAELLEVLRRPYDEQPDSEEHAAKRPEWARHRPGCSTLSCSS